ncbi:MAG: prenyltransferase [Candidatus Omnitrophota bacterium]
MQTKISLIKNIVRALRLPFLSASLLPFVFGSLIERHSFNVRGFILGLSAAVATHLSANLINDYADSKSGADWQDSRFYGLFGGSKLIQEKVFSEKFYLRLAVFFAVFSAISVILLAFALNTLSVVGWYLVIIFLSWSYSFGPLRFSYRRWGEVFIFLLFGPCLVMGGYFIQTGIFPDAKSFILSLPLGLLTTAILFSNEVPDFADDRKAGKHTWVSFTGTHAAYRLYFLLVFLAFGAIATSVFLGFLKAVALLSFVFLILAFKAMKTLKVFHAQKDKLLESSRLTIALQTMVGIVLIGSVLL